MASNTTTEVYDLLILVDATYSMTNYLQSLNASLPKVIAISKLTNTFARIGIIAYRDYSEASNIKNGLIEWSGWYDHENPDKPDTVTAQALRDFAAGLQPDGGGDFPEATKTGLAKAYELMREDATTIILLYTDAPPHCYMVADRDPGSNYHTEQAALKRDSSYGGHGPYFMDWVSACAHLHSGPKKAQVFIFLDAMDTAFNSGYYTYMATVTRGPCLALESSKPHDIAQITIDALLAWMGAHKPGVASDVMPAKLVRYKSGDNIKKIKDERDPIANSFFAAQDSARASTPLARANELKRMKLLLEANVAKVVVDNNVLIKFMPKRKTSINFAERYAKDERNRVVVVDELRTIIESDVTSMALNPVFGTLWRVVCNDRDNPARDQLITAFGLNVDRISNVEEKERMREWLAESYDSKAEIEEILDRVPEDHRFPCVFLDPTVEFRSACAKGEEINDTEESDQSITALRRDELLEIGRSCDGRVLRRLGKILTRLSYAKSAAELPAHIAATDTADVPRIPLSLAAQEQEWAFWKILLHLVVPGTMLAARPATVLAALAIRVGLKPLFDPAFAAMMFWRDKWNNLEVPETWNASCLGLLLDADKEYRKQEVARDTTSNDLSLLLDADQDLFSSLVAYQHTGANLLTTLMAEVAWTPDKTSMPVGPVVTCRSCKYPRSVTIMAEKSGGRCGLCVAEDWSTEDHKVRSINAHVNIQDTEASVTTWVECSVQTCRAQYVCYNPADLNVRAKCHYCRTQSKLSDEARSNDPAPTLECSKCLNKIIWPKEYRGTVGRSFECAACTNDYKTVVLVETSAQEICKENSMDWILRDEHCVLESPFQRSLFHTISRVGVEAFLASVHLFPQDQHHVLTYRGKRLRNQVDLIAQLQTWVKRRTTEKSLCSLCFESSSKERLFPACRRRGCHQQICEQCLRGWYGINHAGTIINTAALYCPFCRRPPAARTLAAYGKGVHAVGGLMKAIEERGSWIHAWCFDCGQARQYMERECARGTPDAIVDWKCEACRLSDFARAQAAEEEARLSLLRATNPTRRAEASHGYINAKKLRQLLQDPVKVCPKCRTPTQKTAGCDHMQCSVPNCGAHWCWSCGTAYAVEKIYGHMSSMHGGWYAGGGGVGEDEDEDED